jgi:hypothetical protein
VTQALAIASVEHCSTRCDALALGRASLSAQLTALGAEANEATRRKQAADRAEHA